jgi:FdhE protein
MMTAPNGVHDARIRRATYLAAQYAFASEVLRFYLRLADFQKNLYGKVAEAAKSRHFAMPGATLREQIDNGVLTAEMRTLLEIVEQQAPAPLAEFAGSLKNATSANLEWLLASFRAKGGKGRHELDPKEELIARVMVHPFAEYLSGQLAANPIVAGSLVCPLCESLPVAGVLRPEGEGGKRFLVCSFCGNEWEFRRIFCAGCGETREEQLPVFVAEQFPHIRVEACDTCRRFLRTIDLTKDGNAVPVVDDLGAIPLTLWADEHGYERIEPNLLGT